MTAAGGQGTALVVDHEDPIAVADLVARVDSGHGRLDVLVNDIFGGDRYAQWDTPMWEHDLAGGLRMLRMGVDTHVITAHAALPVLLRSDRGLLVEMTDGTAEVNTGYREQVGLFYDLVKANVSRIVLGLTHELRNRPVTALGVTPGWLRSENMLDHFGVTEATWRDALGKTPRFAISESPTYVARGLAALAQDPDMAQFAGTVLTSRQLADRYGVTDTDGSRPDAWGYIAAYGLGEQSGKDVERITTFPASPLHPGATDRKRPERAMVGVDLVSIIVLFVPTKGCAVAPSRSGKAAATYPSYLRTAEVADLLHVSPKTVSRWAKEGKLPFLKTLGGHRRYPEAEIRDLVAELREEATA